MKKQFHRLSLQKIVPQQILPVLIVSLIAGLVVITYQISFASLIFSGDLSAYLSNGIGFCLMGVVLIGAIEALLSGNPGMVAIPTAGSAAILAAMAAGITGDLAQFPYKIFPTVTAAITLSTFLTGGAFLLLGRFQLGNLIRYFPYPVVGGFLAGTGWLVTSGALKTMTGVALKLETLDQFLQASALLRWLPGVFFGVVLLLVSRRFKHYLLTPAMILGAVGLFYASLQFTNTSIAQATTLGLLFQPFPAGTLWQPPPVGELVQVDWRVIAWQAGEIATLMLISSITLLLYASGVEVSTGTEINLNRELRACGTGNLAAAFSVSPPGYVIVTMSVLSHRLKANHRLVGLLVAAISAGVMFYGAPLISLFPKPVLGGVLTFIGMTFLVDWLYDGWRRFSRPNYLIVVLIMLTMSVLGLLPGLGVGIALAAGLFIVQYSRVPVVRHILSGRSYRSRVERSQPHAELLRQEGRALAIMELQGYIFFGTANRVYEQLKEHFHSADARPLRVVLLDFRRVNGIDASATLSFVRLKRFLRRENILFGLTQLRKDIEKQLENTVLTPGDRDTWRVFPDLDHGVEWFEDQLLQSESGLQANVQAQPGAVQAGQEQGGLALLFSALLADAEKEDQSDALEILHLMKHLEQVSLQAGEELLHQGEHQENLYFLDAGELTLEYSPGVERQIRLETSGPGTIMGELSFYLEIPSPATVKAALPSLVYRLSAKNLKHLEQDSPQVAMLLHRFLLKRVGQRLVNVLETLDAMSQ